MRPICSPIQAPLSTTTRLKRPFAGGMAASAPTMIAPADSPAMVTLLGSPPNAAMFRLIHCSAAIAVTRFLGQLGMREEAEAAKAIVHRDDHRTLGREIFAVIPGLSA